MVSVTGVTASLLGTLSAFCLVTADALGVCATIPNTASSAVRMDAQDRLNRFEVNSDLEPLLFECRVIRTNSSFSNWR